MFLDLGAKFMIPIHHGTFYRAGQEEQNRIISAIGKSSMKEKVILLDIGESVQIEQEKVTRNP
jgi:L-ascorbate metabolism protein UlaG (beta-lactamase superfamily)